MERDFYDEPTEKIPAGSNELLDELKQPYSPDQAKRLEARVKRAIGEAKEKEDLLALDELKESWRGYVRGDN